MEKVSSIYIHIPFCENICSYCNFTKFYYNKDIVSKYLDALDNEISEKYKNEEINTLYIGGGTPSLLSIKELQRLFKTISKFRLNDDCEFTIEFNVLDITEEKLKYLKENKVNRISIGVQTLNEKHIKLLERNHNKKQVIEKINLAKKYFDNISIDLMYGFYNQSMKELNEDLDTIIKLNPNHISIYSLIIEENTKIYINKIKEINQELESKMYYNIISRLESGGYNHYEISNFSKENFSSKHNLVYWNNENYYGFGLSSSGYLYDIRYTNTKNLSKYLKGDYISEYEKLDTKDKITYEMILGLRKIKGININDFKNKYNKSIDEIFDIKKLLNTKKLILIDNYLSINKDYLYLQNQILTKFI